MEQVTPIGLHITKHVSQAHGADSSGATLIRKTISRTKVFGFFAFHPACMVALDVCGGAHFWAREIGKLGHTVRLIPPA